ncbi:DUF1783-domain-containing protein [Durotheca rogersii]|uniref:DUF1783-domain-containing protein n=1 Tax=Durotheca rogersii TaxID=419775 RepID=UPI00221EE94C|nr:DUF1783-domain-containing protein [Durotheca rogersii]KAI5862391.1 DUF1783-domain-containing protein [Durotheca rogersii]
MWSRTVRRRACLVLRNPSTPAATSQIQRRTLIAPPKPGDGPLMERRPDRELPNIAGFRWWRTLPAFAVLIAAASAAIFNYQRSSSPVVAGTLYALRTSARARAVLGDEIYFRRAVPWIWGEMNQLRGRIDIRFAVRGTRAAAVVRFVSVRPSPRAQFETVEWSLETPDGAKIDLLLDDDDPARALPDFAPAPDDVAEPGDETELPAPGPSSTRGFRQQLK